MAAEEPLEELCPPVTSFPSPGEIHPGYEDFRDVIIEWLNFGGPCRATDIFFLPFNTSTPLRAWDTNVPIQDIVRDTRKVHHLARKRISAPAPYVGLPFRYEWFGSIDEIGRLCSGTVVIRRELPRQPRVYSI
jgi:hypothetical protein